jgi:endonuclease/exonuclease/phosphatase family metal-dependent hydrolase
VVSLGTATTLAQEDLWEDACTTHFSRLVSDLCPRSDLGASRSALISFDVHKSLLARIASDHLPVKAVIEF